MNDELCSKICNVELELGCMISSYGMIIASMFNDDGKSISSRFYPETMNNALTPFLWQMEHLLKILEDLEVMSTTKMKEAKTA